MSGESPALVHSFRIPSSAAELTRALDGEWHGRYGLACCPAHDDSSPSLSITDGSYGIRLKCFVGCPRDSIIVELRHKKLWPDETDHEEELTQAEKEKRREAREAFQKQEEKKAARRDANTAKLCAKLWGEAEHAIGSPIEAWLKARRIDLSRKDLERAPLRWHPACTRGPKDRAPAVLAMMTDAASNEPTGLHRTFLTPDGSAKAFGDDSRWMLGHAGIIRLTPDEDVAEGLGICEGIETGLAIMAIGWKPIWACGSLGSIRDFPVLKGIQCLTVFADPKPKEVEAARECAARWRHDGLEAIVRIPPDGKGDWNDVLSNVA